MFMDLIDTALEVSTFATWLHNGSRPSLTWINMVQCSSMVSLSLSKFDLVNTSLPPTYEPTAPSE